MSARLTWIAIVVAMLGWASMLSAPASGVGASAEIPVALDVAATTGVGRLACPTTLVFTVTRGSVSGKQSCRISFQTNVASGVQIGVADGLAGSAVANGAWTILDQPAAASMGGDGFGACLRTTSIGLPTWNWSGTCDLGASEWYGLDPTPSEAFTTTSATKGDAMFDFAVRVGATQAPGTYTGYVTFRAAASGAGNTTTSVATRVDVTGNVGTMPSLLTVDNEDFGPGAVALQVRNEDIDSATLWYQVCSNADCSTIVAGGNGSIVAPNGTMTFNPSISTAGVYYWRAWAVDQFSATSTQTATRRFTLDTAGPASVTAPTVTGTAMQGSTLTATAGTWSSYGPYDVAYQWLRCDSSGGACQDIGAATTASYTIVAGDVGSTIRVRVTATSAGGATPTQSAQTATVVAPTTFSVTSIVPALRGQGWTGTITINGSGFSGPATPPLATIDGTGVTIGAITWVSSSQLTATLAVNTSATPGTRTITLTNQGVPFGTTTGTVTIVEKPTIINNIAGGDTTWRSTNTGTYDVDFADPNGLSVFKVAAWTGTGETGTNVQPWVTAGALTGTSATTNWSLPASTWGLLAEGVNYVSVELVGASGGIRKLPQAFQVRKDTVAPNQVTSPTPNLPVTTGDPILTWTNPGDPGGAASSTIAGYRIYRSTDNGATWSAPMTSGGTSFTDTTAPYGSLRYRVSAFDAAGNPGADGGIADTYRHRAPSTPTPGAPTAGATAVSTTTAIQMGYEDPDAHQGTLSFQVCPVSTCTSTTWTGTSPNTASGAVATSSTSPSLQPGTTYWYRAMATDQYGATSGWSSTVQFTTISAPTITDNQAGDDTWRRTNDGSYDVDFGDPVELVNFSTSVNSAANQLGTTLDPWQAQGIGGTSHTANWTLGAATFNAMNEGTNWVSVRATGTSGLETDLVDAFYVRKDTVAPTAPGSLTGPSSPTSSAPALSWLGATDTTSGVAYYRVYRAPALGGTWTQVSVNGALTGTSFVDTNAPTSVTSYYHVRAVDLAGNESAPSNAVSTLYTRAPATPVLSAPANGALSQPVAPTLQASYLDPDGDVGQLAFQLCLDSTCSANPAPAFVGASSGTTGSWTVTPNLTAGETRWWRVRAYDTWGVASAWSGTFQLTVATAPVFTDNQAGDATWRRVNDATYDVDVADAAGLSTLQVDAWSAAGRVGTNHRTWTTAVTAGGVTSFTANWALPADTWNALPQGTSWISVRANSTSGVQADLVDAFTIAKDTVQPSTTTVTAASPTIVAPYLTWGGATDATSPVQGYQVRRSATSGGPYTTVDTVAGTSWTDTGATPGTTRYYVVRAIDSAGNPALDSNEVAVRYHRAPQPPTLVSPTSGATGTSPTPTLQATHDDLDGDPAQLTFEVCDVADCSSVVRTTSSAAGIADGAAGSATITPSLLAGTQYWWRAYATDADGAVGATSVIDTFTTSSGPAITNSVVGDATWRRINDGTYDVDVSDPLGLDRIEVRAWTGAGQTGTMLQDWTVVAGSLAGTTYATDWSLPASTWSALQEGTNWITVRATSDTTFATTFVDAFYVQRDTSAAPPTAVGDGASGDAAWTTSTSTLSANWTASSGEAGASGIADYEYCISTGAACTGTIELGWTSTGSTATSMTATGLTLDNGTTYVTSIRMVDAAGNTSPAASSDGAMVDVQDPSGAFAASPASPWAGTVRITGTASDGESGVTDIDVDWTSPGGSGSACADLVPGEWADTNPANTGCDWNTTTVADGSYTLTATITDAVGLTSTATRSIVVDNGAPTITAVRFDEQLGAGDQHAGTCSPQPCAMLWYRPAGSGSVELEVDATDTGVGIASIGWPDLDAAAPGGWGPGSAIEPVTGTSFMRTYSWASGAAAVTPVSVQVSDAAGNPATAQVTVTPDATQPSGGSISSTSGHADTASVTFAVGTDSGSGIATHRIERRTAARSGASACATTWTGWSTVAVAPAAGTTWVDPSPLRSSCHQYQLVVIDNVGNERTYTSASTALTWGPELLVAETGGTTGAIEAGASDTYAVALRVAPTDTVTVTITGDAQLTTTPAQLTFAAGETAPKLVTVTAVDDAIDEVPDISASTITHTVDSADGGYDALGAKTLAAQATDNDVAGFEVAADATPQVSEATPTTAEVVRVRLTSQPASDVSVAVTGDVEVRTSSASLAFTAADWSTWKTVGITAIDDTIAERTPHSARVAFGVTSTDPLYEALADKSLALGVRDDDPARLTSTAGVGWTETAEGHLRLAEDGSPGARLNIRALGDPTRDIVITPIVSPSDDIEVTPASATIEGGSHLQAVSFTFRAVDDHVAEDAIDAGRIAWRVTTLDPLYDTATLGATLVGIADGSETTQQGGDDQAPPPTEPTQPAPDPDPTTPAPDPTPDTTQPPGETVADDGTQDGSTTAGDTTEPRREATKPAEKDPDRPVSRRVKDWASEHPVAASAAASAGGTALLAAKPLALAGKGLAGGGLNMPNGVEELKRLFKKKKSRHFLQRIPLRRRKRRRDDDEDDDDWFDDEDDGFDVTDLWPGDHRAA